MTEQEVFDKVAPHLLTQQVAAYGPNPNPGDESQGKSCLYRGPNGTMCAVGCLIPDEVYNPVMEGSGVENLLDAYEEELPDLVPHVDLLVRLQAVHDRYMPRRVHADPESLQATADALRCVAQEQNLILPEIVKPYLEPNP